MKKSTVLRIICTCCLKGKPVVEDLSPEEVAPRHAALCREAGLIEIPSLVEEGKTVFVCSEFCKNDYETNVGPFRKRQAALHQSDMSGR